MSNKYFYALVALIVAVIMMWCQRACAIDARFVDNTYCGSPVRSPDGTIKRSYSVLSAYAKIHPCPSTGLYVTSCMGWALNHKTSLACGGCDNVTNLMWMRNDVKKIVDGYERKINALTPPYPDTANCVNQLIK